MLADSKGFVFNLNNKTSINVIVLLKFDVKVLAIILRMIKLDHKELFSNILVKNEST